MDRKRELTSVDLAALVGELGDYAGAKVDKAYLYPDDRLRFRMRDYDRGRVELLVDVGETTHVRVADPANVPDAPERPPDFAMMLRNRLAGADLAAVEQYGFDRILRLEFERDDGPTTVVVELFGEGNVAVLDADGVVVDCLETVRLKSRTVAPGEPYEFPEARFDPLTADEEAFAARMADSDTDVVRTLATQLDFGGFWAEELCSRAGVEKTLDIADADEDTYTALFRPVADLRDRLAAGDLDPRVYYEGGDGSGSQEETPPAEGESGAEDDAGEPADDEPSGLRVDATPVPMLEYGDRPSEGFETFTAALDDYFTHFDVEPETPGESGVPERPDFESEIAKHERIIEQQEGAIEDFREQAERERERAKSLYANYDLVDEVLSTVQGARSEDVPWDDIAERFAEGAERGIPAAEAVVDVDGSEGTVTLALDDVEVALDADVGVEKNADRLYKEAKRVEEKMAGAREAVAETREDLEAVKERREQWEAADGEPESGAGEGGDEEAEKEVDWLARSSIPVRQSEQWYERFRWVRTSDDFLVIGGRNADQNEELVQKYLECGDRFLHAQAHGGPVTVLKATGPSESAREVSFPESTLAQAAQFALAYSSVWKDGRHAGDVYMVDPDQVSKTPESGE
ncbi:MAG: ribosome rescue protein RqcH, partial [Halorientalis sp.]